MLTSAPSVPADALATHAVPSTLRSAAARYRTSSVWRGVVQLCTTLIPLAALLWLMYRSMSYSYGITLLLALPTAGFLVRTFIIMHDCAHGSFFPSRRANEIVGFVTGVLTLTPFVQWRRDHALHHASSGDLDRRGHGDILTLTVDEYLSRSPSGKFKYRLYRNPFVLFVLGPLYMLVSQRWVPSSNTTGTKQVVSVHATNAAILVLLVGFSFVIGITAVFLVYFSAFLIAAAAGIWMFYVQHQFEDTYWEQHTEWDYTTAAMRGSSYYKLPRVFEWLTGSIGLHHIHHADPKIPNYNLRRCHNENREFQVVPQLTFRKSLHTVSLKLWDSDQERLIGFATLRQRVGER